jgi:endonuclease/exonuclease/phosphatase family metal-dependent hydrolase
MSDDIVPELTMVDDVFLERARRAPDGTAAHHHLVAEAGLFSQIELRQPRTFTDPASRGPVRIGAWNAERCKFVGASSRLIEKSGCDIVLLSEMDVGMARSANAHTIRVLADQLGFGYAFCAEFLELGFGNQTEAIEFADELNLTGLHGNAILSRYPLSDPSIVASSAQGTWYSLDWHHRRLGGRRALFATVSIGAARWRIGCVHLESLSNPKARSHEVAELVRSVQTKLPTIVGGDFNTGGVPAEEAEDAQNPGWLARAGDYEPLFDVLARAGFDWMEANSAAPTRRTLGNGLPQPPHRRMDWIFCRGMTTKNPLCWPAVNSAGHPISDHELVSVDVFLQ